jgi:hypothetical protein
MKKKERSELQTVHSDTGGQTEQEGTECAPPGPQGQVTDDVTADVTDAGGLKTHSIYRRGCQWGEEMGQRQQQGSITTKGTINRT